MFHFLSFHSSSLIFFYITMLFEHKYDVAGPSRIRDVSYLEGREGPLATHATRATEAFQKSIFNDEAPPPAQQTF